MLVVRLGDFEFPARFHVTPSPSTDAMSAAGQTPSVWFVGPPQSVASLQSRNDEIRQFLSNPKVYYAELRREYDRQLAAAESQSAQLSQDSVMPSAPVGAAE